MAYVPNPTDASQPTEDKFAKSAAAEFRALKAYIATIVAGGGPGAQTPGMIADFAFAAAPPGWLHADGTLKLRADFPALWALVLSHGVLVADAVWASGNNYGSYSDGDGSTTFRIPDFRSMVRKGADNGRAFGGQLVGKFTAPSSSHQHRIPFGFDSAAIYGWMDGSNNPIFGSQVIGSALRGTSAWGSVASSAARIAVTEGTNMIDFPPPVPDWNIVASNGVMTCIKT